MSTPRSRRNHSSRKSRIDSIWAVVLACAFGGCLVAVSTQAKQTDSSQPVLVKADNSVMDQDKEIATLTGHVNLDQGTMHVDGDKGVGYFDENNQVERAVATGNPANFHQTLDDNSLVHGSAANIDYRVSDNTIILTGNAVVVHEGQGEFHGAKLTYNTDTGNIVGEGGTGGQVHMILQPKAKGAPASKTSSASKPAVAPASAKPASASTAAAAKSSAPASTSSAATSPVSGASTGTH